MTDRTKVAVVVGSLRKASLTRRIANALCRMAPDALEFRFVEIRDLPLYNEDLDHPDLIPAPWIQFRADIADADAVLFATPEYNRSVPGVLKNAIDVGSRPYGRSIWEGRPAVVVTVSPGAMGGFGANHHLRQSLVFLNMPTLQQPEAYIGHADALLTDAGDPAGKETEAFLSGIMVGFAAWTARISRPAPDPSRHGDPT